MTPTGVAKVFDFLVPVYGPPKGDEEAKARLMAAWVMALRDMPDELALEALPALMGMDVYGWPKPADLKTAAYGRVVKVPEFRTDCWGGKYSSEGAIRWHEVRVPVDFVGELHDIDELPASVKEHQKRLKNLEAAQLPTNTEEPRRLR